MTIKPGKKYDLDEAIAGEELQEAHRIYKTMCERITERKPGMSALHYSTKDEKTKTSVEMGFGTLTTSRLKKPCSVFTPGQSPSYIACVSFLRLTKSIPEGA